MGSGLSLSPSNSIEGIKKEWMEVFTAMQFSKAEVISFYEIYNAIDTDKSGEIEVGELLKFLCIENSIFTERIFEAFDKDGTGKIDFFEFVVSLWKFCALGKESINVFAFDLYDTDADGALTEIEVKVLFHDLYWYGIEYREDEKSRRTLADLMKAAEGFITIEEFRPFCQKHQALLKPVFDVQHKLREAAMGVAFWDSMSTRKIELSKGHSVQLGDLMVKASDREDFNRILNDKGHGGMRQMMHSMLLSAENSLHFGGGQSDTGRLPRVESEQSLSRLFNPFRARSNTAHNTMSRSRSGDEQDDHRNSSSHGGGVHRVSSNSGEHDYELHQKNSSTNNNGAINAIPGSKSRKDHKDSVSTVPTIELGTSGELDGPAVIPLGE